MAQCRGQGGGYVTRLYTPYFFIPIYRSTRKKKERHPLIAKQPPSPSSRYSHSMSGKLEALLKKYMYLLSSSKTQTHAYAHIYIYTSTLPYPTLPCSAIPHSTCSLHMQSVSRADRPVLTKKKKKEQKLRRTPTITCWAAGSVLCCICFDPQYPT